MVAGILGIACGSAVQAQSPSSALPQSYPAKPIRLIVGYTPGGGTDVLSRVLAKYLGEDLKQTVIVDNRPGAGGLLATQLVANAPPDGYTLLTTPSTHAINPGLHAHHQRGGYKD
jgi:tripartite-type tricarboxylate transporter receptor subunit TctC